MTFWFVDASVLLAREDVDDEQHLAACELLAGDATLATLDLAYYEVGNVAVRAWSDLPAAARLHGLVAAIAADGGLVRADEALNSDAVRTVETEGLSVDDAGCVAGAARAGVQLVSCDVRDLVNRDLAVTPSRRVDRPEAAAGSSSHGSPGSRRPSVVVPRHSGWMDETGPADAASSAYRGSALSPSSRSWRVVAARRRTAGRATGRLAEWMTPGWPLAAAAPRSCCVPPGRVGKRGSSGALR